MNTLIKSIFLIGFAFISCSESNEMKSDTNANFKSKTLSTSTEKTNDKEFYIYFIDWDQWGRTSRNCDGFGLCHFRDCWFCCLENDFIVNCNEGNKIDNAGELKIYKNSKKGFLTIKLNPQNKEHLKAITNREVLYIDENISNSKTTLIKGAYNFNPTVGKHGGYIINAFEN